MTPIRILITGGTFDKEYDEINGRLFFKDSHLPEMLALGRARLDLEVRTLMMVDSLDMTDADRTLIAEQCRATPGERIVITHGPTRWPKPRALSPSACKAKSLS